MLPNSGILTTRYLPISQFWLLLKCYAHFSDMQKTCAQPEHSPLYLKHLFDNFRHHQTSGSCPGGVTLITFNISRLEVTTRQQCSCRYGCNYTVFTGFGAKHFGCAPTFVSEKDVFTFFCGFDDRNRSMIFQYLQHVYVGFIMEVERRNEK